MRKKVLPVVAAFFFSVFAWAQDTKPLIRFSPLYTQGIGIEETRFIESLIQSYLSDMGEVISFFSDTPSFGVSLDSWTRAPDYVVSGSIYLERDSRVFTLEIHNTLLRDTHRTTTVHKTASDLALKARSLVENAFSDQIQSVKGPQNTAAVHEEGENPDILTENRIAGTWRGESGIEMVRLQQGGRGVAFFSSGAQMSLSYTIENNTLIVKQSSPNTERFYYPLPFGVARQLSAEAEPMRWELLLYSGGTHLKGVKISTEAKLEENNLVELLPHSSKDTLWVRANQIR